MWLFWYNAYPIYIFLNYWKKFKFSIDWCDEKEVIRICQKSLMWEIKGS